MKHRAVGTSVVGTGLALYDYVAASLLAFALGGAGAG